MQRLCSGLMLLTLSGCAVYDGLDFEGVGDEPLNSPRGISNEGSESCASSEDCSVFDFCVDQRCVDVAESGIPCTNNNECYDGNVITCPGGSCWCENSQCVHSDNEYCGDGAPACAAGSYCVGGSCIRPIKCGTHDDCPFGICTAGGCKGHWFDMCDEDNPCDGAKSCIGDTCLTVGGSCTTTEDCGADFYCGYEGVCYGT